MLFINKEKAICCLGWNGFHWDLQHKIARVYQQIVRKIYCQANCVMFVLFVCK
jgi:hypothetical protein